MQKRLILTGILSGIVLIVACNKEPQPTGQNQYPAILEIFGSNINPGDLPNY